jgi:SAM-dependent methyltransferase
MAADVTAYDRPDLYDAVAGEAGAAELNFYLAEARGRAGEVLELGCGTGRLAIPLAREGQRVTGLDLSSAMLAHASNKAAAANVAVKFVRGDIRAFEIENRKFGLIFIALNSLLHLHSAKDIVTCFRAVTRHLAPGGAFIFDVFNPSLTMLTRRKGERYSAGTGLHPALGELTVQETFDYDAASQVNRQTWYWSAPGKPDFLVHPLNLRSIFPQEMPLLIESGGLRLTARYGDFDRSAFVSESRHQICVCEAAA